MCHFHLYETMQGDPTIFQVNLWILSFGLMVLISHLHDFVSNLKLLSLSNFVFILYFTPIEVLRLVRTLPWNCRLLLSTVDGYGHRMTPKKKMLPSMLTFHPLRCCPISCTLCSLLSANATSSCTYLFWGTFCVCSSYWHSFCLALQAFIGNLFSLCLRAVLMVFVDGMPILLFSIFVCTGFLSKKVCLQKVETSHDLIKNISNATFKLHFSEGDLYCLSTILCTCTFTHK